MKSWNFGKHLLLVSHLFDDAANKKIVKKRVRFNAWRADD